MSNNSNNSFTSQSLIVLMCNANGINNRRNGLIISLNEKRIDLALISEINFTTNTKFLTPGYNLITSNHPNNTAHSGFAILINLHYCLPPV